MTQIMVKVRPDIAEALRRGGAEASELTNLVRDLGLSLRELHPGATDSHLTSYYVAEADDLPAMEEAAATLASNGMVEGAYVKPSDELPGGSPAGAAAPDRGSTDQDPRSQPADELP